MEKDNFFAGRRAFIRSKASGGIARLRRTWKTQASRRVVSELLVAAADPLHEGYLNPTIVTPALVRDIVNQAADHGVLPIVAYKAKQGFVSVENLLGDEARNELRVSAAFSMMLRQHARSLLEQLQDLPVALVKGETFARLLYPSPALRPFTDIDLLVAPSAIEAVSDVLARNEYFLGEDPAASGRREWKWVHKTNPRIMVELHTNLVHAPSLQNAMSFDYERLQRHGPEHPVTLLAIAVIHGALHRFERLRHVVDVCQAARKLDRSDDKHFRALMIESHSCLAASTALRLAYRFFGEARCEEICASLGPVRYAWISQQLLGPPVVLSMMNEARYTHSWRRQVFRELLKRAT